MRLYFIRSSFPPTFVKARRSLLLISKHWWLRRLRCHRHLPMQCSLRIQPRYFRHKRLRLQIVDAAVRAWLNLRRCNLVNRLSFLSWAQNRRFLVVCSCRWLLEDHHSVALVILSGWRLHSLRWVGLQVLLVVSLDLLSRLVRRREWIDWLRALLGLRWQRLRLWRRFLLLFGLENWLLWVVLLFASFAQELLFFMRLLLLEGLVETRWQVVGVQPVLLHFHCLALLAAENHLLRTRLLVWLLFLILTRSINKLVLVLKRR